ncbi:carbonic anhydrase [Sulfurovum sp.]|uniref:carbonic anhydrase n=1 Tax=Sulfurovum sp. TaxID=1969726 RepID=UPI0026206BEA|nr:carbonic anhydrase [Sulfurovum sp.]
MHKIFDGVIKFKDEDFESHKKLFEELKEEQNPHTFYIGCSDSRIVPNLITKTLPGEVFVLRNIANIIPPASVNDGRYKCSASILEYAVKALKVENIVVCGHSNCGGLKALYYPPEELEKMPLINKWLDLVADLKDELSSIKNTKLRAWKLEQLNIVRQIQNLLSYSFVREKYETKELKIYGWYYIIQTGEVYNYDFDEKEFKIIT